MDLSMVDAICVCDRYSDMLAVTLPRHRRLFREFIVATRPDDADTVGVCEANGATVIPTDAFDKPGRHPGSYEGQGLPTFNKGAAMNVALGAIADPGWVLIVDADIIVPRMVIEEWRSRPRDHAPLYGAHRVDCVDMRELKRWDKNPRHARKWRKVKSNPGIGYFQLFHAGSPFVTSPLYSEAWAWAGDADSQFAKQFKSANTVRLTEPVVHLYHGGHKDHWFGRTDNGVRWESETERVKL